MGFTNLTFTNGQKITSTIMAQVDGNFDSLAEGDSSAPRVQRPIVWVHFCGFSTADKGIYAQRGVSSFTRNGTGDYTIVFTNPFSSDNIGVSISTDSASAYDEVSVRNANAMSCTRSNATFRYKAANSSANANEDQNAIFATFWEYSL